MREFRQRIIGFDSFNRPDGDAGGFYGWESTSGGSDTQLDIVSNLLRTATGAGSAHIARQKHPIPGRSLFVQTVIGDIRNATTSFFAGGPALHVDGNNMYYLRAVPKTTQNNFNFEKIVGGSFTWGQNISVAPAVGDILRLECVEINAGINFVRAIVFHNSGDVSVVERWDGKTGDGLDGVPLRSRRAGVYLFRDNSNDSTVDLDNFTWGVLVRRRQVVKAPAVGGTTLTPTIGSGLFTGISGRMDLGITINTEV